MHLADERPFCRLNWCVEKKFSLQSITTPNNLTCFSETITVFPFNVRLRVLLSSDELIINWNLSGFACIPLSVTTQLKIWYYMIDHGRGARKGVIICVIVQGSLSYEHVHVIDENIEQQRVQDGALGHSLWQGDPFTPCISNLNSLLTIW